MRRRWRESRSKLSRCFFYAKTLLMILTAAEEEARRRRRSRKVDWMRRLAELIFPQLCSRHYVFNFIFTFLYGTNIVMNCRSSKLYVLVSGLTWKKEVDERKLFAVGGGDDVRPQPQPPQPRLLSETSSRKHIRTCDSNWERGGRRDGRFRGIAKEAGPHKRPILLNRSSFLARPSVLLTSFI